MEKVTYIPHELVNSSLDEHGNRKPVTRTHHIFDDQQKKSQSEINKENKERLDELEETVGTGGSIDERIAEEGAKHYLKEETYNKDEVEDLVAEEVAEEGAQHYLKTETYNKTELNNLITTPDQHYVSVTATDQTTSVTDVLPATGEADTIYRVGNWDGSQFDASVYSEYAWSGSSYVHLNTKTQVGEVFDISAYHATGGELAKYADLTAALGTSGANIPQSIRNGGMSVKFVQSSDNKYVQYRLKSQSFDTNIFNWQSLNRMTDMDSISFKLNAGICEKVAYSLELGDIDTSGQEKDSIYIYRSPYFTVKGKLCISVPSNHYVRLFEYVNGSLIKYYTIIDEYAEIPCKEDAQYRVIFSQNPIALPTNENLISLIDKRWEKEEIPVYFESGGINNSGVNENDSHAYRTDFIKVENGELIEISTFTSVSYTFVFRMFVYDTNKSFLYKYTDIKDADNFSMKDGYIRVMFRNQTTTQYDRFSLVPLLFHINISELLDKKTLFFEGWSQGSLNKNTGLPENYAYTLRTGFLDNVEGLTIYIKKNAGYKTKVYYYSERGSYIGCDENWDESETSVIKSKSSVIRILLAKIQNETIVPSEGSNANVGCEGIYDDIIQSVKHKGELYVSSILRSNLMAGTTLTRAIRTLFVSVKPMARYAFTSLIPVKSKLY